jgi:hypothetical protein
MRNSRLAIATRAQHQRRAQIERQARALAYTEMRARAKAQKRPMPDSQIVEIALAAHMAIASMSGSCADDDHWHVLACAMNYTLVLCELGIGADDIEIAQHALGALVSAQDRRERLGRWGFTGDELTDIRVAVELHTRQLETATREQLTTAQTTIHRRLAAGDHYKRQPEQEAA